MAELWVPPGSLLHQTLPLLPSTRNPLPDRNQPRSQGKTKATDKLISCCGPRGPGPSTPGSGAREGVGHRLTQDAGSRRLQEAPCAHPRRGVGWRWDPRKASWESEKLARLICALGMCPGRVSTPASWDNPVPAPGGPDCVQSPGSSSRFGRCFWGEPQGAPAAFSTLQPLLGLLAAPAGRGLAVLPSTNRINGVPQPQAPHGAGGFSLAPSCPSLWKRLRNQPRF